MPADLLTYDVSHDVAVYGHLLNWPRVTLKTVLLQHEFAWSLQGDWIVCL